jgi:hypothetical protein
MFACGYVKDFKFDHMQYLLDENPTQFAIKT